MLAEKFTKRSFKEIATHIQGMWHTVKSMPQDKRDEVAQQRAIRNAWEGSWQPSPRSSVGLYLGRRLGKPWSSVAIRESSSGMVSLISDIDGNPVNVHITCLNKLGEKDQNAQIPKRVMPGKLPDGSAIRIWNAAPIMGIAEGIESAMSAAILFKMPVWSVVNASLLAKWIPPQEAKEIHIFADNDENFTGQSKAYALANRLVVQFERKVVIHVPDSLGEDWNDVLLSQGLK
jgi:putative DNA primase/helicase